MRCESRRWQECGPAASPQWGRSCTSCASACDKQHSARLATQQASVAGALPKRAVQEARSASARARARARAEASSHSGMEGKLSEASSARSPPGGQRGPRLAGRRRPADSCAAGARSRDRGPAGPPPASALTSVPPAAERPSACAPAANPTAPRCWSNLAAIAAAAAAGPRLPLALPEACPTAAQGASAYGRAAPRRPRAWPRRPAT